MQPGDQVQKSAAGRAALASPNQDLPQPLRTLLLTVYGNKTAAQYSEVASRLPVGRDGFQKLIDLGLVEVLPKLGATVGRAADAPPPPPRQPLLAPMADAIKQKTSHTSDEAALQRLLYPEFVRAVSDLGLRGMILVMKVERTMSAKELLALREQVETAVGKSKGDAARAEFTNRVNFLLSQ